MDHRIGSMTCVRLGVRDAWRQRGLVILLWALFLAAALLAAAPAWRWWNATLSTAPEGDRLLDGLNVALLRELSHEDRSPTFVVALAPFSAFLLAALVLNPFVTGGLLSVLSAFGPRAASAREEQSTTSLWTRFFAGGARHYGLFLRLLLFAGIVGVLLAGIFMIVLLPILRAASTKNWERAYLLLRALVPVALAIAFWLTSLLLDVARIRAMRDGERRAWRALRGGSRFMWRNAAATLAIGIAFALLTALAFVVYFVVSSAFTPKSWLAILLAMAWQQMLSLTRTGLRVSMLAAELELVHAREPIPAPPLQEPAPAPLTTSEAEPIRDLPPLA